MNHLAIAKEPGALEGMALKPPAVFLRDEKSGERFFGFFTAHVVGIFLDDVQRFRR